MATKKISALSTGTTANATDKLPIERSGANAYITPQMLWDARGLMALCKTATDITYTTSPTRINFATKTYDPGSAVTTGASWVYTVPATGYYRIELFEFDVDANGANWAAGDILKVYAYKNASYLATLAQREFDVATTSAVRADFYFSSIPVTASFTAGNTIHAEFRNNTAASRILYSTASIAISRVA